MLKTGLHFRGKIHKEFYKELNIKKKQKELNKNN
jgi:hypothetical protein